jgi:hypothetical protein
MSSDFITCFQATNIFIFAMWVKHIHTTFGVRPGDHYKTFQWFYLACNIPTEISPPVWASHPPRSHLLCLMGSSHRSFTRTIPRLAIAASPNIPTVCHRNFPAEPVGTPRLDSTTYYAKPYLYKAHGCTIFMGVRSINRSLDLGMITNHRLPASHQTKP